MTRLTDRELRRRLDGIEKRIEAVEREQEQEQQQHREQEKTG